MLIVDFIIKLIEANMVIDKSNRMKHALLLSTLSGLIMIQLLVGFTNGQVKY